MSPERRFLARLCYLPLHLGTSLPLFYLSHEGLLG